MVIIYKEHGLLKSKFMEVATEEEAIEICTGFKWEYTDENGFKWDLTYKIE